LRFQLAGLSAKTFNATRSDLAKRIAEAEEEHNEDKLRELLAQLKDL